MINVTEVTAQIKPGAECARHQSTQKSTLLLFCPLCLVWCSQHCLLPRATPKEGKLLISVLCHGGLARAFSTRRERGCLMAFWLPLPGWLHSVSEKEHLGFVWDLGNHVGKWRHSGIGNCFGVLGDSVAWTSEPEASIFIQRLLPETLAGRQAPTHCREIPRILASNGFPSTQQFSH